MNNLSTAAQRQAFDEQGYLLVRGVLDEEDFAPASPDHFICH